MTGMKMGSSVENGCAMMAQQGGELKSHYVATTRELLRPVALILVVFGIGATVIVYTMWAQDQQILRYINNLERDRDENRNDIEQLAARIAELEKERQATGENDGDDDEDDDVAYDTLQMDNTDSDYEEEEDMSDISLTGDHRRIRRENDDSGEGKKKKKKKGSKNAKNSRRNDRERNQNSKKEKRRHDCSASLKEPKCMENILPAGLHLDSSVPNLNPIEKSQLNNKSDPLFELEKDGYNLSRHGMRPTAPLIKLWKVADEFQERGTPAYRMFDQAFAYNSNTGLVTVKQSGLYYVYSQVLYAIQYISAAPHSSHSIRVNNNLKFICMKSVDYVPEPAKNQTDTQRQGASNPQQAVKPEERPGFYAKHKTCYTGGLLVLAKNDVIGIYADLMLNSTFYSMESGRTFWGIVRMRSFNSGRK